MGADNTALHCEACGGRIFASEIGKLLHDRTMHSEAVPDAALGLPWIQFPSDPTVCDAILEHSELAMKSATSTAERRFWETLRVAIADRGARERFGRAS